MNPELSHWRGLAANERPFARGRRGHRSVAGLALKGRYTPRDAEGVLEAAMTDSQPSSRSCFVCGRDNPVGLKVRFVNDREAGLVRGTVRIAEHFNGYPGVAHGGIVGALLDETAGRTVLLAGGAEALMVTAKLEITYRRPTPTGCELLLVGRLLSHSGDRAEAEAEMQLGDGTVTARCRVLLAPPPASITARFDEERPYWRVDQE
jgi:acyl-coenzyme A thioesterase PaaI-like protein